MKRTITTIGLLLLCVAAGAITYTYNWNASEYVLSYGNTGFVTYQVKYNLIEADGVPLKTIYVKLLNKGAITGKITEVEWSPGNQVAVVSGEGTHIYDIYTTVDGRLVKTTKRVPVKVELTFQFERLRAAWVAMEITAAADGSIVYNSNGYWSALMFTYMKGPE